MKGLISGRGQVSIELIIITAALFLIVSLVFGYYFSISDSTIALITIKAETIKELNTQDMAYVIKEIEFCETDSIAKFNVVTEPGSPNPSVDSFGIKDMIAQKTKWDSANIELTFNAGPISCS